MEEIQHFKFVLILWEKSRRNRHDHVTKLGFRWFFRIVFTEGASSSCSLCSALHSSAAGWTMAGETEARRLRTNGFVFHGKASREWIFPAMFFSATFCSELYFYFCDDTCRAGNAYWYPISVRLIRIGWRIKTWDDETVRWRMVERNFTVETGTCLGITFLYECLVLI